jgi:acetylornithine deacetylase
MSGNEVRLTEDDERWLTDLVAVPSVSPFEGGDPAETVRAQQVFRTGAQARGFRTVLHEAPLPAEIEGEFVPVEVRERLAADPCLLACQPSVVVAMGDDAGPERTLVINFHIDTVGPHIPPTRDGRRLAGRGVLDDKGPGVAAVAGVARAFADRPDLAGRIRVLVASVPGEEAGAMGVYGTRWLVARGLTGALMLFAEPSEMWALDACTATMTAAITVNGSDSTDDYPAAGHNASLALGWLAARLGREYAPLAQAHGGKLTIGGLHTGTQHNRVYGTGELRLNIAYGTAGAGAALEAGFDEFMAYSARLFAEEYAGLDIAARLAKDWPDVVGYRWLKRRIPPLRNTATGETPLTAMLHASGFARPASVDDHTFTCDAVWAAGPGRHIVICGPGGLDRNQAHTTKEWISLDDLNRYATGIRDLVLRFADHHGAGAKP